MQLRVPYQTQAGNVSGVIFGVKSDCTPYAHLRLRGQDDLLREGYLFWSHARLSVRPVSVAPELCSASYVTKAFAIHSGPVVAPTIQLPLRRHATATRHPRCPTAAMRRALSELAVLIWLVLDSGTEAPDRLP